MSDPQFKWHITVLGKNTYNDAILTQTPAVIIAKDMSEVTTKVRAAFNAKYDDFRGFWSHSWKLNKVEEIQ